ncbi:MAG: hypothetical protein IKF17_01005 [Clostridia bacterium]|nr:hypothetical protein [Clostridia bacterium]
MKEKIKNLIILLIIITILCTIKYTKFINMISIDNLIIFNLFEKDNNKIIFNLNSNTNQVKSVNLFNSESFSNQKIAPGTKGKFEILLKTQNNVKYQIKFDDKSEKPKNLVFNIKDNYNKYSSLQELEKYLQGSINSKDKVNIVIEWSWEYETDNNNNIQDTIDGKNIEKYMFDIKVRSY